MLLFHLNAFFLVSRCLSISANDQATRASEDAFFTMNIQLMPCVEDHVAEVFGAFNSTFNSCMKAFDVAIQFLDPGEVLCTH